MSLRIIAGEARGIPLRTPKGRTTRPTLGRVRESLFMILAPILPEARVLDLYAGSGALGLEALSRGAAHVTFIEQAHDALQALKYNIRRLNWRDRTTVIPRDALPTLRRLADAGKPIYDLILADPPYGVGLADKTLRRIDECRELLLNENGLIVMQLGRRDPLEERYGDLVQSREVRHGETRVVFFAPMEHDNERGTPSPDEALSPEP